MAHQPGFDRVVFDFGSPAGGVPPGIPEWVVEQASSFVAPSGQSVPVAGSSFIGVRFQGAGQMGSYQGPTSFRPAIPLVREVRLVEDFEGVLAWGLGLERLVCPRVSELSSPDRLVVDLPSPP